MWKDPASGMQSKGQMMGGANIGPKAWQPMIPQMMAEQPRIV